MATGAIFGALNDARALIGPFWALGGIIATLVAWALVEVALLFRNPAWRTRDGTTVWLSGLGERARYAVLGLLALLLLPALLPTPTPPPVERAAYTISSISVSWVLELPVAHPALVPCIDWLQAKYGEIPTGPMPQGRPADTWMSTNERGVQLFQLEWKRVSNAPGACESRDLIFDLVAGGQPHVRFYKPPMPVGFEPNRIHAEPPVLDLMDRAHSHPSSKATLYWNPRYRRLFVDYADIVVIDGQWLGSPKLVSAVDLAGAQLLAQRAYQPSDIAWHGQPHAMDLSAGIRLVELTLTINSLRWILRGEEFTSWSAFHSTVYAYTFPASIDTTLNRSQPAERAAVPAELWSARQPNDRPL